MTFGNVRNRRGAGSIGCLLLLIIAGAAGYAGYQLGLPRMRHSSFEDRINESMFHFRQQPVDSISKQIIEIAREFDIELTPKQVRVDNANGRLNIDVTYEKFVDIKVWQTTLLFSLHRTATF